MTNFLMTTSLAQMMILLGTYRKLAHNNVTVSYFLKVCLVSFSVILSQYIIRTISKNVNNNLLANIQQKFSLQKKNCKSMTHRLRSNC